MSLAVVLPSRGLVFSRTIDEILRELRTVGSARIFFAHSLPIPDCFNEPCYDALDWGASKIWIVEEDMYLPSGILWEMLTEMSEGHPIVAADYPVLPGVMAVSRDENGVVMTAGTGCMLADAYELKSMLPFDVGWQYVRYGDKLIRERTPSTDPTVYGQHDVDFSMRRYMMGKPIHITPTRCNQFRVVREATPKRNELGWHEIALIQEDTSPRRTK